MTCILIFKVTGCLTVEVKGKTNEVMKQNYVLLVVWHDFSICTNR